MSHMLFFTLQVCDHLHSAMRSCGAEAITSLVSAALLHNYDPPLHENKVGINECYLCDIENIIYL